MIPDMLVTEQGGNLLALASRVMAFMPDLEDLNSKNMSKGHVHKTQVWTWGGLTFRTSMQHSPELTHAPSCEPCLKRHILAPKGANARTGYDHLRAGTFAQRLGLNDPRPRDSCLLSVSIHSAAGDIGGKETLALPCNQDQIL